MKLEAVKYLVIHHSAGPNTQSAAAIRRYHTGAKPRGRGWSDVGYHWLIESDGAISDGRMRHVTGAHCPPHNRQSWGVCVIGDNTRDGRGWTAAQREALARLVDAVRLLKPEIKVVGHGAIGSTSTVCPGFEADDLQTLIEGEL